MYIREALVYGKKFLAENSKTAFLDSLLLLQKASGMTKEKILASSLVLPPDVFESFNLMLNKRKNNMPVQYIINKAEFMGLEFYVDENVLIPRCDTEVLVEEIIKHVANKKLSVLDLCTGSGCIAVSLKKFCPNLNVTGIDISQKAVEIAKRNAEKNNIEAEFVCGDIFEKFVCNIPETFDIIVSNPPYIQTSFIDKLEANVKEFEPKLALDGGEDGLDFYRFIAEKVKHSAKVFFEIGAEQAKDVSDILSKNEFYNVNVVKDLSDLDRVVFAETNRRIC